jgi:catechol 2,3-dioxygenase-like lactoylglutathione lyase family enzyme
LLSELVLVVKDVSLAADFYEELVGLELERPRSSEWAWFLLAPNQRLALHTGHLLFEEMSPLPEGQRFGPVHFALEVHRDELLSRVEKLRLAGLTVHGPTRLEWMKATSFYFCDPDANLVEYWSPDP